MILLFSCSLNPQSRSRVLAIAAREAIAQTGEAVEFVDLQDTPLPLCDGATTYGDPNAVQLQELGAAAEAIVIAAPVYNYGVSAATKNLVELTGRSWTGKPVGLLLAAGGHGSYMSGMGLANSLMLDFRCLVLPRYVYAVGESFTDDPEATTAAEFPTTIDEKVATRINQLAREVARLTKALRLVRADQR